MTLATRFRDVITTEDGLREILGHRPTGGPDKVQDHIDEHFAGFISRSPFILIGSSDAQGNLDISPKGDPAGFVQVLDEHTLAIPDRPGNRRADTFTNILQHPNISLFFLVPGVRETLRVQGRASIVADPELRERMAVKGKVPKLAIVVDVHEAFMHCAKCIVRSQIWQTEAWPDSDDVPNLAGALVEQMQLSITREQIIASLDKDARENLY